MSLSYLKDLKSLRRLIIIEVEVMVQAPVSPYPVPISWPFTFLRQVQFNLEFIHIILCKCYSLFDFFRLC